MNVFFRKLLRKPLNLYVLFLGLLCLELMSNTILINELVTLNPVIWLLSSISAVIIAFFIINNNYSLPSSNFLLNTKIFKMACVLFSIIILIVCYKYFQSKIDPHWSDVMPATELYVKRFLNGSNPYDAMPIAEWIVIPNYPPLRWLPFVISEFAGIDYRWTSMIFMLLFLWGISLMGYKNQFKWLALFYILSYILFYILDQKVQFELTSEFIIGFFYLFLAWAILRKNDLLIAIGIVCCIFSRFYIVYFLPLYFFVLLCQSQFKKISKQSLLILGLSLVVFLPYKDQLISDYFNVEVNFTQRSIKSWGNNQKLNGDDTPEFINKGLSFSSYFYNLSTTNTENTIRFENKVQTMVCFLALAILCFIYYRQKNKILHKELYLVLSLKILLVLMLSFNSCPFPYLYCFPILLNYFFVEKLGRLTNNK
jgi:hypothetical protein